jgi:outer membrane protein assembly factor BamB
VPQLRSTICCRFFAQSLFLLASLATAPAVRAGGIDAREILPTAAQWSVDVSASPAAAPVVVQGNIVLALRSGQIVSHSMRDGKVIWRVDLRTEAPLATDGHRVFVVAREAIHALNAADGAVVWQVPAGSVTAPLLALEGWIIAASSGHLTAYRAADGQDLWRQQSAEQRERPTIEGDTLYIPLVDGSLKALDLETGRGRWTQRFAGSLTEVLAFADRVYVGSHDKSLYCLSASSGEVKWQFPVGAAIRGRPAADAKNVYVGAMDNLVRAFDRRSGALKWKADPRSRPIDGPTVVGSSVVVPGTAAELKAWQVSTGSAAARIPLGEPLVAPPAFAQTNGITIMAAVTGGLNEQWKLSQFGPPLPTLTILPLTALPGVRVEIRSPGG